MLLETNSYFFPHEHIFWKEILCWMYLKECGPIFILHNKSQAVSWNASVALKSFEEKRTAHHRLWKLCRHTAQRPEKNPQHLTSGFKRLHEKIMEQFCSYFFGILLFCILRLNFSLLHFLSILSDLQLTRKNWHTKKAEQFLNDKIHS